MEDWVFLGESGSDAESVCFLDGGDDDKDSETSFAMVQLGRSHAKADGGKNQDEEDDDEDYFDLNLPALAGSKAVFGANGDCFDLDLAASILSMGSVGYDTGSYGAETEDHVDTAELIKYDDVDTGSSNSWESEYDEDDEHPDTAGTDKPRKPYIDPLWLAALDDFMKDSAEQRRLAAMAPLPWRQVRPPGAPHLFFPQPSHSSYSSDEEESDHDSAISESESDRDSAISELVKHDDEDDKHSDAVGTDEPRKPYIDPLWQAALDDFMKDSAQQRRLAAMAPPPWRQVQPLGAPHLFFSQPSRSTYSSDAEESGRNSAISEFVNIAMTRANALTLFDAMESLLELPFYDLSRSDWKAALDKAREEIAARQRRRDPLLRPISSSSSRASRPSSYTMPHNF